MAVSFDNNGSQIKTVTMIIEHRPQLILFTGGDFLLFIWSSTAFLLMLLGYTLAHGSLLTRI